VEAGLAIALQCTAEPLSGRRRALFTVFHSGSSLSCSAEMRRQATERAPSSRHAHPENSMNDGL
jgi:hypothetical protein